MKQEESEYKEFKFKPILGSLPEMGATDWWTDEQWAEHYAYVEKLKKEGRFLTEGEEITVKFKGHPVFDNPKKEPEEYFTNFGILMPNSDNKKTKFEL